MGVGSRDYRRALWEDEEVALKGLTELFFGEDVAGSAESNYTPVEEDGVIEVCGNAG